MAAKYEVLSNGESFRFNLKAGNGEIILSSESYKAKASALNGIESCRTNSPDDGRYERKVATNGQHYFLLKAANGETIGRSELYQAVAGMENGIASVKTNGPVARVEDTTA